MKTLRLVGILALAALSCSAGDGWIVLHDQNGDLSAWTGMDGQPLPTQTWTVEDGMLRTLDDGSGGDLRTKQEFSDFELVFEWKISPKGNAGVKYMVQEEWIPSNFKPSMTDEQKAQRRLSAVGPEYQLIDDERINKKDGWESSATGALYLLYAPETKKLNPPGAWNTSKIVVDGNHGEHWLNGEKLMEFEFGSDDMLERVKKTKFIKAPGFGIKGAGPIVLQHHGHPVWFKTIKLRPL